MVGVPIAIAACLIVGGLSMFLLSTLGAGLFKSARGTTYASGQFLRLVGGGGIGSFIMTSVMTMISGMIGGYTAFKVLGAIAKGVRVTNIKPVMRAVAVSSAGFAILSFVWAAFVFPTRDLRIYIPASATLGVMVGGWMVVARDKPRYLLCPKCERYVGPKVGKAMGQIAVSTIRELLPQAPTKEDLVEILRKDSRGMGFMTCRICPKCGDGFVQIGTVQDAIRDKAALPGQWISHVVARPLQEALEIVRAEEEAKQT